MAKNRYVSSLRTRGTGAIPFGGVKHLKSVSEPVKLFNITHVYKGRDFSKIIARRKAVEELVLKAFRKVESKFDSFKTKTAFRRHVVSVANALRPEGVPEIKLSTVEDTLRAKKLL